LNKINGVFTGGTIQSVGQHLPINVSLCTKSFMTTYRPAHIYLFAVDQHLERKEQKGIARFTRKEKRDFFFLKEKWTCNLPKKKILRKITLEAPALGSVLS